TGDRAYDSMVNVAENIKTMSEGRLIIESHPSGAIAPATKELEAIGKGEINGGQIAHEYGMYMFPQAYLFAAVSGGLTGVQQYLWFLNGGGNELVSKMYKGTFNVENLGEVVIRNQEVWAHSTKPLNSLADMKGLKMRTSGACADIVSKIGGAPTFLPGGEIYESASRGVIDAFEYVGADINWTMGFHEVADYLYLSPSRVAGAASHIIVNGDDWNELTPGLQKIVSEAVAAEPMRYFSIEIAADYVAIEKYVNYGTQVSPLPKDIDDAYIAAAKEFYAEEAAADPIKAEILESMWAFQELCDSFAIH
ncbi:TRAP transporter substrate-binding protein DctP, partial [Chloroflexota bacterium]